MNPFQQYIDHGWKLCYIEPGTKGPKTPGWNNRDKALTSAGGVQAAGLMHAYSGTCALDIDNFEEAEKFLQEHGISLKLLFSAPDAVSLSSGAHNRAKLLYHLETPLPSKTWGSFELRCGSNNGKSVQDVLPPSPHPSGREYKWAGGDWRKLPALPAALRALWQESKPTVDSGAKKQTASTAEIQAILDKRDPNANYNDGWIQTGMALHHEFDGSHEGLAMWDQWSAKSDRYPGYHVLESHWRSFGTSETPVTLDSLRRGEVSAPEDFQVVSGSSTDIFESPKEVNPFLGKFLNRAERALLPTPTWIIPEVMPERGIGCIWGSRSSGKTFVAIDAAIDIATGGMWQGLRVKQGPVLYIAAESGFGVRMRLDAALDARGLLDPPVRLMHGTPNFTSKKQQAWMIEAVKSYGKQSVIFVDTMASVLPGIDENSTKDTGLFIDWCKKLEAETETFVILVHHAGKDVARGPRGSSLLTAGFEMEWCVERGDSNNPCEVRTVTIAKLKESKDGGSSQFRLKQIGKTCVMEWLNES